MENIIETENLEKAFELERRLKKEIIKGSTLCYQDFLDLRIIIEESIELRDKLNLYDHPFCKKEYKLKGCLMICNEFIQCSECGKKTKESIRIQNMINKAAIKILKRILK